MIRSILLGGAAVLTTLTMAVTGCTTTRTVSQDQVEEAIQTNLGPQLPGEIEDVTCPDDLKGEIGESMQCTMTVNGQELKVDVTVSSIEGSTVNFNMEVVA